VRAVNDYLRPFIPALLGFSRRPEMKKPLAAETAG